MKKTILILIFVIAFSAASAQILPGGTKSVYEDKHSKSRTDEDGFFFIQAGAKLCQFKNDNGLEIGLDLGGSISGNFYAGIDFYTLLSSITYAYGNKGYALKLTYLGPKIGYLFIPFQGLDIDFALSGNIAYADFNPAKDAEVYATNSNDWFFTLEPSISAAVHTSEKILFGVSGAYRKAAGFAFDGLGGSELDAFIPGIFFRVQF